MLTTPELFQVFNGGIVCTATHVEVHQEGNEQWVEAGFDETQLQGIVNGGHTYGCCLHVVDEVRIWASVTTL